jgi:hypothetical protein
MTERNREYIIELFKIVSSTSILVVDHRGNLKRLQCSFRVVAIVELPPQITVGAFYMVEAVKMTLNDLKEVFIIESKGYYYWYFRIK